MNAARCPWWRRWAHRWARAADRRRIWVALRAEGDAAHPADPEAAVCLALRGWAAHITRADQPHWRCACADDDR